MNTYSYNINGERRFIRAITRRSAWWKVFYGELDKRGSVDMSKIDLKQVANPRRERMGNKVFDNLRHI